MLMFEKYVSVLRDNSLKITPQRLEIMKYLDKHRTHPTADEIYTKLKQNNPSLSKTTVYNALETLKNHKIIHSVTITGIESRYDYNDCMHHHFLCTTCGDIIDIDIKCPNIEKIINDGYYIEEVHGYFKGICKKCRQKGRKQ